MFHSLSMDQNLVYIRFEVDQPREIETNTQTQIFVTPLTDPGWNKFKLLLHKTDPQPLNSLYLLSFPGFSLSFLLDSLLLLTSPLSLSALLPSSKLNLLSSAPAR